MNKSGFVTLGIFTLIIVIGAMITYHIVNTSKERERNQARQDLIGEEVNAAPYTDLTGAEVTLDSYLGQVLVVNAWASWSPFSRDELPLLNSVAAEFSEEITVLAVNRSETKEETERFMRTMSDLNHVTFILDPDDRFFKAVDGYAMPETIIYNELGEVVLHRRGMITEAELRNAINEAIGE